MDERDYDELVRRACQGLEGLEHPWRRRLEDVQVSVKEFAPDHLVREGLSPDVRGIYLGTSARDRRGDWPPLIILFQRPTENYCATPEELRRAIDDILHHELGHHLGLAEADLPPPERQSS